jgi:large subunit ribosomal protein L18
MLNLKERVRIARHNRGRKRISSTHDIPRLCVHRSLKNLYIQVIDDQQANTLFSLSTLSKELKGKLGYTGNIAAAQLLGEVAAEKLKQKGILNIVFDRGGYLYHGRIKALAESLRKGGIVF